MPKMDKKGVARRVKTRRTKLGLTQTELGDACGMSQQGILNIEKGIVGNPRRILELASVLLTSPEWLMYELGPEDVRPPNPVADLMMAVHALDPDKIGAALEFMKRLSEAERAA